MKTGRKAIQDEFSNLPISKQRKWQLRRTAEGKCRQCGQPVVANSVFCLAHLIQQRDKYNRRKTGRTNNCLSRRLEAQQTQ